MRLKSIDKYIKEKLQGYKPAYSEDLWEGIKEKLPARVPNGNGSWMWPAAAAVVIVALVPFMVKFSNITGRTQQIAQNHPVSNPVTANLQNHEILKSNIGNNNSGLNSQASGTVSANVPTLIGSNETKNYRYSAGKRNIMDGIANSMNQGKHDNRIAQNSTQNQATQNTTLAINETASNRFMDNIESQLNPVENNVAATQSSKDNQVDGRYIDRKGHNLTYSKWNNWQSIFYPFWDNPAYTGSEGFINVTLDDRSEFVSEPKTALNLFDFGLEFRLPLGFGVGYYHNQYVTMYSSQSNNGFALSKSILHFGSTSIKIGASVNFITNSLFFNSLNYPDQVNQFWGFIKPTNDKNISETSEATGINGGIWINNPHIIGGFDVVNINKPHPAHLAEAAPLPREYRATFGYRFGVNKDLQFLPMAIVTRQNTVNQGNTMLTAVYKDRYMLTLAYQNIDPLSGRGNASLYAGVVVKMNLRLFVSYGEDMELEEMGVNDEFFHVGIKYQIR